MRVITRQLLACAPVFVLISGAQTELANPTRMLVLRLRNRLEINAPLLLCTAGEKSVQKVG